MDAGWRSGKFELFSHFRKFFFFEILFDSFNYHFSLIPTSICSATFFNDVRIILTLLYVCAAFAWVILPRSLNSHDLHEYSPNMMKLNP